MQALCQTPHDTDNTTRDANVVTKNELIGSYQFDVTFVYLKEHHELYHQWVGLMNEEADHDEDDIDERMPTREVVSVLAAQEIPHERVHVPHRLPATISLAS